MKQFILSVQSKLVREKKVIEYFGFSLLIDLLFFFLNYRALTLFMY
jgi:hypothetical protein